MMKTKIYLYLILIFTIALSGCLLEISSDETDEIAIQEIIIDKENLVLGDIAYRDGQEDINDFTIYILEDGEYIIRE